MVVFLREIDLRLSLDGTQEGKPKTATTDLNRMRSSGISSRRVRSLSPSKMRH